jgi:hypothetical protein
MSEAQLYSDEKEKGDVKYDGVSSDEGEVSFTALLAEGDFVAIL